MAASRSKRDILSDGRASEPPPARSSSKQYTNTSAMATRFSRPTAKKRKGKLPDTSDEDSSDDWKPSSGNAGKKKSKSEDPEKKQLEEQVRALQAENARLAAAKRDGRKEPHEAVEWIIENKIIPLLEKAKANAAAAAAVVTAWDWHFQDTSGAMSKCNTAVAAML